MARRKNSTTADVNTKTSAEMVHVPVGKGGVIGHVVGHLVGKALPFAGPWVGAAALPPVAGLATNAMWGGAPLSAGLASAGLAVGGAALSAVTWKAVSGTSKAARFRRVQATASVAAGMGWLTAATSAGPFGHPMTDLWLLGGGLVAASCNLRQLMRNGAHGEAEESTGGGLAALAEAIGWEKVRVRDAKGSGKGTVAAAVAVEPGATIADVQSTTGKVAAALQIPPSGVVITPDAENGARGTVSLRVADLLKDGVPFAPPLEMGLLPTEPIPVGLYADGEVWAINPFAAAILQHLLVMGVTGAGKSEFARGVLAHLMTRRKMTLALIDCSKGRQSMGHIKDGLDVFITDQKEARRFIRSLPAAIKARGDQLADEGLDQWTPESSLNAMLVWLEEAADLADFEELDKIARAARSVGIWLVISLQRATWTNVSTDVRANLQASACFGVDDAGDAGFCLPDRVTDAGAIPAWGSDRPGYAFATGMGIPEPRWTMEARAGLTERDVLVALVEAGASYRDPLDETTANAMGQVYAQRTHRGTNRLTPGVPPAPPAAAPAPLEAAPPAAAALPGQDAIDSDDLDDVMSDSEEMELQEVYDEVMGAIPSDPEPDADYAGLGLDDDMPDSNTAGIEFEAPPRPSAEEARDILCTEIDGWMKAGRLEFEPSDLIPATLAAGRKRPWMQGELKKLTELGVLRHDSHGSYTIVHSPLVPA
ncbi:type IV secretory system conjugative DNA transfer family protein [Streptomyces nigrescens]